MSDAREHRFRLPDIGEGIAEAEIVAWHVSVGDLIAEDDPLADVMTDKATVEMSAPVSGRVISLGGAVGDMVPIGSVLAVFEIFEARAGGGTEPAGADFTGTEAAPAIATSTPTDGTVGSGARAETGEPPAAGGQGTAVPLEGRPPAIDESGATIEVAAGRRTLASPAVRQRARSLGIDLADVMTATSERVRHSDLDAFLSYNRAAGYALGGMTREDELVKVIGLRRRIAENMAASKRHIPHFTYVESFEVTKLEAVRADLNASRGSRPKLTPLPFLIMAICRTLPAFPMLNARFDDEAGVVTRHGSVHMGIATQTDAGLVVPVLRGAEQRNLWQLADDIDRLATSARSGKLPAADLSGSTLTITSLGTLAGISTTPVINRPEVAIIGPNKIVESVVVRDGEFAVAKLMNISLSCDHRVVDGWDAASFMQALKRSIETPAILLAI